MAYFERKTCTIPGLFVDEFGDDWNQTTDLFDGGRSRQVYQQCHTNTDILEQQNIRHSLLVMGEDSCSEGCRFESQHSIINGHIFTFICYND